MKTLLLAMLLARHWEMLCYQRPPVVKLYIYYIHTPQSVTVHIPVVFVSGHILEDEEDCADY